jgi:amidase
MEKKIKFSGPELCKYEAHEVVKLLKNGDVSSGELLDAATKRISQTGKVINATPTLCEERARMAARSLESSKDSHDGWLAGLPITIKDLNIVAGVRTTYGSKGFADFIPDESDPLVQLLEARGGIVLGKTNTPEFGAGGNTFNEVFGATLNPWDTSLNAGGSSGGAAASLATGEIWLSHGSDHGGSLRTPAAYCGVVGLRPSPGMAGGPGKDNAFMIEGTQGPMARSVMDCALFLDAMSGFDPRIAMSFPEPKTSYQDAVTRVPTKLAIAFSLDLGGFGQVDKEMDDHLRGVLRMLENNGVDIEETCPDLSGLEKTYHTLRGVMWATAARSLPEEARSYFKPTLAQNTVFGQSLSIDDIVDANINRSKIYNAMVKLFEKYDVLACPTVGCMPHLQSEEWVDNVGGVKLSGYMDWLRFAFLATTAGLPSISVPVGLGPRGLPVGLQLIGKPRGEAELLSAARLVELTVGGPLDPIDPIQFRPNDF